MDFLASFTGILATPLSVTAFASDFYAYYTSIASNEDFEQYFRTGDHADLVLKLGNPEGRLVFWRGASYLPYWETGQGRWFLDELIARRGDGEGRRRPGQCLLPCGPDRGFAPEGLD